MQPLKILLFAIVSAIIYGILHDQITAHICVEYFTIGHERIFATEAPTLLAFGWGVLATWWVGLSLGIPLAVACRVGNRPKLEWRDLVRPMVAMLGCCYVLAAVAGTSYFLWNISTVYAAHPRMSQEVLHRFEAVHVAHIVSYLSGSMGGVVLICWVWRARFLRHQEGVTRRI